MYLYSIIKRTYLKTNVITFISYGETGKIDID